MQCYALNYQGKNNCVKELAGINIRPLSKLASASKFEGDGEHKTGTYSDFASDLSTASTYKLATEVEFRKRSILQKWRDNHHYTKAFQYEAEKLGFVKFLRNHDLYCETIDDGPEFVTTAKAYLITCRNGNDYFMQFDSFKKE